MFLVYIFNLCRISMALLFMISFAGKIKDIDVFQNAISSFAIIPKKLISLTKIIILGGELVITVLLVVGGNFATIGFCLSICFLLTFTGALISVLVRRITTQCSCFGPSDTNVSWLHIWRNLGLVTWSLLGWIAYQQTGAVKSSLGYAEWFFTAALAILIVTFVANLEYIAKIFYAE